MGTEDQRVPAGGIDRSPAGFADQHRHGAQVGFLQPLARVCKLQLGLGQGGVDHGLRALQLGYLLLPPVVPGGVVVGVQEVGDVHGGEVHRLGHDLGRGSPERPVVVGSTWLAVSSAGIFTGLG